jgi:hypothetical protein
MKLKKGDKLTFFGLEKDSDNGLTRVIFETAGGNKLEFSASGEDHAYHCIAVRTIDQKKLEEEMEI